jgi:hypothetical protein
MSTSSNEPDESTEPASPDDSPGISDDQLPEDLQPTDDNPLAKNPDEDDEASDEDAGPKPGEGSPVPPPTP